MQSTNGFPLLRYEELDSTSSECSRLLREGKAKAPFAVWARQQSAGRGRRGHQWLSPTGNLFLSFVLSAGDVPAADMGLLPLKVANLVSWWFATKFDIRVTLKWPNDIYYGGAKLGGVLCESSTQGERWGDVIVGIGLNINVAPDVADQSTVALRRVLGRAEDVERLAHSLTRFFELHWAGYSVGEVVQDFQHFGIEAGQIWLRGQDYQQAYRMGGIDAQGALELVSVYASEQRERLNATTDDYRWMYSRGAGSERPLVVADVGNTAIKLSIFRRAADATPDRVLHENIETMKGEWLVSLGQELLALGIPEAMPWPIHALSVNQDGLRSLRALSAGKFSVVEIPRRPLRYRGQYNMSEIGMDRFAMIESILQEHTGHATLIVGLGTATTIDAVSDHGVHLGGWIIPGLQTALTALAEQTDGLPLVRFEDLWPTEEANAALFGTNTRQAMVRGALRSTQLAIRGVRESFATDLNVAAADVRVVLSGGFAPMVASGQDWTVDPHLVARGARLLTLGGDLW